MEVCQLHAQAGLPQLAFKNLLRITGSTLRLHYKGHSVSAVQRNNLCLLHESHETSKPQILQSATFLYVYAGGKIVTMGVCLGG
jgi:hypothetical protein